MAAILKQWPWRFLDLQERLVLGQVSHEIRAATKADGEAFELQALDDKVEILEVHDAVLPSFESLERFTSLKRLTLVNVDFKTRNPTYFFKGWQLGKLEELNLAFPLDNPLDLFITYESALSVVRLRSVDNFYFGNSTSTLTKLWLDRCGIGRDFPTMMAGYDALRELRITSSHFNHGRDWAFILSSMRHFKSLQVLEVEHEHLGVCLDLNPNHYDGKQWRWGIDSESLVKLCLTFAGLKEDKELSILVFGNCPRLREVHVSGPYFIPFAWICNYCKETGHDPNRCNHPFVL